MYPTFVQHVNNAGFILYNLLAHIQTIMQCNVEKYKKLQILHIKYLNKKYSENTNNDSEDNDSGDNGCMTASEFIDKFSYLLDDKSLTSEYD